MHARIALRKAVMSAVAACLFILIPMGAFAPMAGAADAPAVRLALDLSDGSRILGTSDIDRIKLTTQYADLEIQLSRVRTIVFSAANRDAQVILQNGDMLTGRFAAQEIAMNTVFGKAVIPMAKVNKIRIAIPGGPLPEGLVLYYKFDEGEGEKVSDASDSGNDGVVKGATWAGEGKSGSAMSFNGDGQAIITKNSPSLQLQDFTIAAWVKRGDKTRVTGHGIKGNAVVFSYGEGGYGFLFNSDGSLGLAKIGSSGIPITDGIHDDAWHHVAVTKKGSKLVFYCDGVAFPGDDYSTVFEFNTDAGTGARGDNAENSFIGLIDELMVFKRALSEDEIKGIYDSQK